MSIDFIALHPRDNLVVAAKNLPRGYDFQHASQALVTLQEIPLGHKLATQHILRVRR